MRNLKLSERKGIAQIFLLIGMLLVAIALPIATKLVQQNQENRSSAASSTIIQDSKCKNAGGTCQKTSSSCSGSYKSGYCPSSDSSIKCCVKSSSGGSTPASGSIVQDDACKNAGGTCQKTSTSCSGTKEYKSGLCPSSGSDIKCCAPKDSSTTCSSKGGTCVTGGAGMTSGVECTISSSKDGKTNLSYVCSSGKVCCIPKSSTTTTVGKCTTYTNGVSNRPDTTCVSGTVSWVDSSGSDVYYNWKCMGSNSSSTTDDVNCSAKKNTSTTDPNSACTSEGGTCLSFNTTIRTGESCSSNGTWDVGKPCQTGKACCMPFSAVGCSSLTQANCEKSSKCFLGDKTGKDACEAKRSNGSACKDDKWCAWSYASGKCATRTAATPTPTGASNVGASCLSTDGSYQAFDESKCKGNTHCDRTTGKCVANTSTTYASCTYEGTTYENGYKICRNSGILTCLNGNWSTPGTCKYGCRTSTTCAVCKEGVTGTAGGCESGHTCYQGTCINSGNTGSVNNSTVCKNKGGVCATFSTALKNGASCKAGTVTGIVMTGLCSGDSKTVCCVARAPGINYTPTPTVTKTPDGGGSKPPEDDNNPPATVAVTGISVSPASFTVKVGGTQPITATVTPSNATDKTVTWSSDKPAVAEVNNTGLVTGKSVGTAVITAKTSNNKTATVNVTVTAVPTTNGVAPKISFKFSLRGVKPSYKDDDGDNYNCFDDLDNLKIDVVNSPTNTFQSGLAASFDAVSGETNVNGDQVFKVTGLPLDSKFASVSTFNYLKVKGPFHLKRRMCLDGQSAKLSETTICNISLVSNTVYDFSDYNLLAGDVNADGVINSIDYSYVKTRLDADADVSCGRDGDLNMDGVVNALDTSLIKDSLSSRDDE